MEKEKAQAGPSLDRVYIDSQGKFYKAKQKTDANDAEVNFPTGDMLKALDSQPITKEEMIAKINHPEFHREQAVIAQ